jgi:hypothetical protein
VRIHRAFTGDQEIAAIGRGVLDRTLPKPQWTHAAHFAAAAWLIRCRPDMQVEAQMPEFIRLYNEATGVANTDTTGYHETITQASIRATRAFLGERPTLELFVAVNELLSSPLGQPEWLLEYWSRERLFSAAARRAWVNPDLKPLAF